MKHGFNTFQAAVYLLKELTKINKECWNVDFSSLLKENQRNHLTPDAIEKSSIRGNRHIYGVINHHKEGGRIYYNKSDLNEFIKHCIDNNLTEYMLKGCS